MVNRFFITPDQNLVSESFCCEHWWSVDIFMLNHHEWNRKTKQNSLNVFIIYPELITVWVYSLRTKKITPWLILSHTGIYLFHDTKASFSRNSHWSCSAEKYFLKLAKFTGKHLARVSFLSCRPEACNFIKKRDSGTDVFLWICKKF